MHKKTVLQAGSREHGDGINPVSVPFPNFSYWTPSADATVTLCNVSCVQRAAGSQQYTVPASCVWLCVDGEQPSCFHASLPMCEQHPVPLPVPSLVGTGC